MIIGPAAFHPFGDNVGNGPQLKLFPLRGRFQNDLSQLLLAAPGLPGAQPGRTAGDIARGRLAYGLYAVGITPLAPGTFLRTDGLRSIRRSFTPAELRAALAAVPGRWTVSTPAPFRVLAEGSGRA